LIAGKEVEVQLDKKAMPGELGPCFMLTESGCFKGYISRQKNYNYKFLGMPYYTNEDLELIIEQLGKSV